MAGCEPMDVDSEYEDKENYLTHPQKLLNTENVEELDVSEINMKLRMSCTPISSPLSQSVNNSKKIALESGDNSLNKFTSSNNTILHGSGDFSDSNLTPVNSMLSSQNSIIDTNKNITLVQSDIANVVNNNVTITADMDRETHAILNTDYLLHSKTSSTLNSRDTTSPITIAENPDQGMATSPIIRGLKSVFNMFRPSQSPIQPESQKTSETPESKLRCEVSDMSVLASTPVSDSKSNDTLSPNSQRQGVNFSDDLVPDLQWHEDSTIIFSNDKAPIRKLFPLSRSPTTDLPIKDIKANKCEPMELSIHDTFGETLNDDNTSALSSSEKLDMNNPKFYDCLNSESTIKVQTKIQNNNVPNDEVEEQFFSLNRSNENVVIETDSSSTTQNNQMRNSPPNDSSTTSRIQVINNHASKEIKVNPNDDDLKYPTKDILTHMTHIEKAAIMAASVVSVVTPYPVPPLLDNGIINTTDDEITTTKSNLTEDGVPTLNEKKDVYCETMESEVEVVESITLQNSVTNPSLKLDLIQALESSIPKATETAKDSEIQIEVHSLNDKNSSKMIDEKITQHVVTTNDINTKKLAETENILDHSIKVQTSKKIDSDDCINNRSQKNSDENFEMFVEINVLSPQIINNTIDELKSENKVNHQHILIKNNSHLNINDQSENDLGDCNNIIHSEDYALNSSLQSSTVVSLENLSMEVLRKNKSGSHMINEDALNNMKSNMTKPYNAQSANVTSEKCLNEDQMVHSNESSLYVSLKTPTEFDINDCEKFDQKYNCIDEIQNSAITKIKSCTTSLPSTESKTSQATVIESFNNAQTENNYFKSSNDITNNGEIDQLVYSFANESISEQQTPLDSEVDNILKNTKMNPFQTRSKLIESPVNFDATNNPTSTIQTQFLNENNHDIAIDQSKRVKNTTVIEIQSETTLGNRVCNENGKNDEIKTENINVKYLDESLPTEEHLLSYPTGDILENNTSLSSNSPEFSQNETVIEVNTEDEDTIEGPFDEDIANVNDHETNEISSFEKDENTDSKNGTPNASTEKNFLTICMDKFSELMFQPSEEPVANTNEIEESKLAEFPDFEDDFKSGEIFINAEDFDFLMNKNCQNEVSDCGKESLFLKFDPLCAQPVPTNVVVTTSQIKSSEIETKLNETKTVQESVENSLQNDLTSEIETKLHETIKPLDSIDTPVQNDLNITSKIVTKLDETRTAHESIDNSKQNEFNLTLESACTLDDTLALLKENIPEKPVMAVTPAVNSNPLLSRSNLISIMPNTNYADQSEQNLAQTPRQRYQSNLCTSPAIAAIDQLISLSENNTPINSSSLRLQQNQGGLDTVYQLSNHLAEKEQQLKDLREESKDLKSRLTNLESQVKILEDDNSERLKNIDNLTAKLASKIKANQEMAVVVEEYERTIASLIRERDEENMKHEQERAQLIQERDEQTAHLASMEVSFNDLHSKYEKSKQIIYSYKSNEDILRKVVEQHEENLKKMNENYELLKQHATSKLNNSNMELEKIKKSHDAEVLKLTALLKRKDLHISSLEETVAQKSKANDELTAICDELIAKVV